MGEDSTDQLNELVDSIGGSTRHGQTLQGWGCIAQGERCNDYTEEHLQSHITQIFSVHT